MEKSQSLPELSPQEKAILHSYQEWFGNDPNTTVYLSGSKKGSIEVLEQEQRFEIRENQSLSQNFIDNLMASDGVKVVDARVDAEQTLGLMNEIAKDQFKPVLSGLAANDSLDMDLDDGERFSPGM
mgnify:CR=1 FL=1